MCTIFWRRPRARMSGEVTSPTSSSGLPTLEINGLSDVGVDLTLVRRSRFAPIEAVTVRGFEN